MQSIFGGGIGKKKWADRRGGTKTRSLLGVPVEGLRGGGGGGVCKGRRGGRRIPNVVVTGTPSGSHTYIAS